MDGHLLKPVLASAVACLVWCAGCARGPLAEEVEQTFSLRPGQSMLARGGGLRVGFEAVLSDSRCPRGEQCVWAGDASARFWLQQGTGPRQTFDLHTAPGLAQTARRLDHEIRLLRLEPYPVAGKRPAMAHAVATLTLNSNPASDPER